MMESGSIRRIAILGSTGSVGRSTLDLVARNPERYAVEALTAHSNHELLAEQARRFRPSFVAIADETRLEALRAALDGTGIAVGAGEAGLVEAAARPSDWVMAAIVGAAGLRPTMAAVDRGTMVAIANKECLVCAGELLIGHAARSGATLLPVDSEHNAIFQVLDQRQRGAVARIILTASGGPFRTATRTALAAVTPAQAVAHPNWEMGAKISVDSATMMNKGLELIEAHHLFAMSEERIEILIHPQSIVHSMVEYADGSMLAQMGAPDMRTPIAYTLAWPDRIAAPVARLDLAAVGALQFEAPDPGRFPALTLARNALKTGGNLPTVLNAANEIAVAAFLEGRIGFLTIVDVVGSVLDRVVPASIGSLEEALDVDAAGRAAARDIIGKAAA